jgi:UDP-N-acetylglucosamine 2-epimerase (non-hydrolysing)
MIDEGGGSSKKQRVLALVGTRPEVIKMAPVVQALDEMAANLECHLALTGQHGDLVHQILDAFSLVPDLKLLPNVDLKVMREGQDLYDLAHAVLDGLRGVFREVRPDLILVQGDTASVFFGTLVAFFEGYRGHRQALKVGHVEAGLRSRNKWAPYPEEMFRRLADVLTDLHFAPTPGARENLLAEGYAPSHVFLTGNTVVDALKATARLARAPTNPGLTHVLASGRRLVLLTAHRRESFLEPQRVQAMFSAIRALADVEETIHILYPVHPNPRVSEPARELLSGHERITLVEPLDYLDLVSALERAHLVLTDSGGIQEEAPTFGVPTLVLREVTERPEGVEAGVAHLVGTDPQAILGKARELLAGPPPGDGGEGPPNPYGDGRAGERIADIVASSLLGRPRDTSDWDGA